MLRTLNHPNADACGQRAIWESLTRYCCYDKRQKRQNFGETMEMLGYVDAQACQGAIWEATGPVV